MAVCSDDGDAFALAGGGAGGGMGALAAEEFDTGVDAGDRGELLLFAGDCAAHRAGDAAMDGGDAERAFGVANHFFVSLVRDAGDVCGGLLLGTGAAEEGRRDGVSGGGGAGGKEKLRT